MIPEETVEQILAKTDIVDLISSYFPLKRAGTEYVALCPFHSEKTPSFSVNPSKQMYYCFGCGAGGGAARFLMDYENLDFPSAIRRLGERVGISVIEEKADPELARKRRRRDRLLELHREAAKWYHRYLLKKEKAQKARDYLKSRGLGISTAKAWQLGYAPGSGRLFFDWAARHEFEPSLLQAAGLASRREGEHLAQPVARFRDRLMFPICNRFGEVIAFSGRVLEQDAPMAKYVNSPETDLFSKGKTLFGFHKSIRPILREGHAIVCEGQMDLITCFEAGIENIVAPLGTAFTHDHARTLKAHTDEVILCFDADSAGFKAAVRSFEVLTENNVFVKAIEMPPGEDPDSLIRKEGVEAFRQRAAGAVDFFEFHVAKRSATMDLGSPRHQQQLALELAEQIALISDKLMQDTMINAMAARLRVSNEELRQRVHSAAQKRKRWKSRGERASGERGTDKPQSGFQNRFAQAFCQLLLVDAASKAWFRSLETGEDTLVHLEDGDLIRKVRDGHFDSNEPGSVPAFLATLPRDEERLFSQLMANPPLGNCLKSAQDHWVCLKRQVLQRRRIEHESLLKRADTDPEKWTQLHEEIQTITAQIQALSGPFPSEAERH